MRSAAGRYGYTADYPMERLYRNVRITTIFEGATECRSIGSKADGAAWQEKGLDFPNKAK
jgi:hypothetical protein